ncbi:MAG: hypothetical protein R2849_08055 [Thermomicrobiales bacterium]
MNEKNGNIILGIDIGGSGIKGALVDVDAGELIEKRYRIPTPQPSKPKKVAKVVKKIVDHFEWDGPVGATFPAILRDGVVHSAANVDKKWIGTDGRTLFEERTGLPFEPDQRRRRGWDRRDDLWSGTGQDRDGADADARDRYRQRPLSRQHPRPEHRAWPPDLQRLRCRALRRRERPRRAGSQLEEGGKRVGKYLDHVEFLFSPDLITTGGGV